MNLNRRETKILFIGGRNGCDRSTGKGLGRADRAAVGVELGGTSGTGDRGLEPRKRPEGRGMPLKEKRKEVCGMSGREWGGRLETEPDSASFASSYRLLKIHLFRVPKSSGGRSLVARS